MYINWYLNTLKKSSVKQNGCKDMNNILLLKVEYWCRTNL